MANIPWMDLMMQWLSAPEAGWLLSGFFLLIICWKSYRHQQILQQHQHEQDALDQQWQRDKDALHQADLNLDQLQLDIRTQERSLISTQTQLEYFQTVQQELALLKQTHQQVCDEKNALHTQLQLEQTKAQSALKAASEKLAFLEQSQHQHRAQFEQLAEQILSKKTAQTQAQHENALDHLLSPLRQQLEGFEKQMQTRFGDQAKERHTLVHEIHHLQQLNQTLAQQALDLTEALRGNNKQQGSWGEVILGRILEESGLREGHEYQTQVNATDEMGRRFQPDVIVHLPQDKDVVIDAKITLVAYERHFHAKNPIDKKQALGDHLSAIRNHLRQLSRKDYQDLHGIQSLDYVLMFLPIESAFQLAIEAEPTLIKDAFDHNIMIVSPTTLLVALRTIHNLWRYEQQNQNAQIIADKAAKLYDKVRLFLGEMDALGCALDKANNSYRSAVIKLSQGRGNLLKQTESFKELGVDVKREIQLQHFESEPAPIPNLKTKYFTKTNGTSNE